MQFRRNEVINAQSHSDLSVKLNVGTLVKSGSFSGTTSVPQCPERHTASDPSAAALSYGLDSTSGADTDDEKKHKKYYKQNFIKSNTTLLSLIFCRTPLFKLKVFNYPMEVRDSSPGKSSINAAEEQSSSLSEQAWDSYQVF